CPGEVRLDGDSGCVAGGVRDSVPARGVRVGGGGGDELRDQAAGGGPGDRVAVVGGGGDRRRPHAQPLHVSASAPKSTPKACLPDHPTPTGASGTWPST